MHHVVRKLLGLILMNFVPIDEFAKTLENYTKISIFNLGEISVTFSERKANVNIFMSDSRLTPGFF